MKVLVTGATGFVGSHLVRRLAEAGHQVRAGYRERARLGVLEGLEVAPVRVNIMDIASLKEAAEGCDAIFHVAAMVASTPADAVWKVNALSPELACKAAAEAGVGKVVLTSTVAAMGTAEHGKVAHEDFIFANHGLTYVDSKHEGEARALAAGAARGVQVSIASPGYVFGPEDPTGTSNRTIKNYLMGRLPGVVDSTINVVDVDDVARGHILVAENGEPGERYALSGHNIGWPDLISRVAAISGKHYPVLVFPREIGKAARLAEGLGLPLPVAAEGFELMGQNWGYRSLNAKKLGFTVRPLKQTLQRTVDWFEAEIDQGSFSRRRSTMSLVAKGVQAGDRLGLFGGVVDLAEKLSGRQLTVKE